MKIKENQKRFDEWLQAELESYMAMFKGKGPSYNAVLERRTLFQQNLAKWDKHGVVMSAYYKQELVTLINHGGI